MSSQSINQEPKREDNIPETKRARLPKTQVFTSYSDDENYVDKALSRIGPTLDELCVKNHWHIDTLKDRFDVRWFPTAATFSRMRNNTPGRCVSAGQLFELRRVSGISLDELADGGSPFCFEDMTDDQLALLMEQITLEVSKRLRH